MASIFDQASFILDFRNSPVANGLVFPLKPNVKDLAGADGAFTRASVGYRRNRAGLYVQEASGMPRVDYDGGVGRYLPELGATNLFQRSEEFDNAYWSKVNMGVTQNVGVAPNGTTTADKLVPTTANAQHRVERVSTSTNAVHAYSIFAKADGYDFLSLRMNMSGGDRGAVFNLSAGTVGTTDSGIEASIQAYTNGWYRLRISGLASTNSTMRMNVQPINSVATDWVADGTSGVLVWGGQLETGPVATTYVPTTSSTMNRSSDSLTFSNMTNYIGLTEGTLYAEVSWRKVTGTTQFIFNISDATTNNRIAIYRNDAGNELRMLLTSNGVQQTNQGVSDAALSGTVKAAFAYNTNDAVLYVNGSSVSVDTGIDLSALASMSQIDVGQRAGGADKASMPIGILAKFKTRLLNDDLAFLTT